MKIVSDTLIIKWQGNSRLVGKFEESKFNKYIGLGQIVLRAEGHKTEEDGAKLCAKSTKVDLPQRQFFQKLN